MTDISEQKEKEQQEQQNQPSSSILQPHKGEPAGIKKTSLIQRIITGAIFAFVMLAVIIFGSGTIALPLFCALIAILGVREFYRLVRPEMKVAPQVIGALLASAMPLMAYLSLRDYLTGHPDVLIWISCGMIHATVTNTFALMMSAVIISLIAYMLWMAVTPSSTVSDITASLFGALYLGAPLMCLVLISAFASISPSIWQGFPVLTIAIIISIWAADSFAYLGGSLFGRHKLAPVISPKKSWEGLIAGMFGAVLAWYLVYGIFYSAFDLAAAAFMGIIVSFTSLAGDLFESRLKREAGVKDSGTLLPGHGGVLDRLDSLFFTLPVIFLLTVIFDVILSLDFAFWSFLL